MRQLVHLGLLFALALTAMATTLERLTLDQMVAKSTMIVRGKVLDAASQRRGSIIYTVYRLSVTERIKGATGQSVVEVYLPGGTYGGYRQTFAGTPVLTAGAEYVVFIWASPKSTNEVIGLGQGVFDVKLGSTGELVLSRGPLEADVVDALGRKVDDQGYKLTLQKLRATAARMGAQ